eukprot:1780827-Amphidinium_carterae.1
MIWATISPPLHGSPMRIAVSYSRSSRPLLLFVQIYFKSQCKALQTWLMFWTPLAPYPCSSLEVLLVGTIPASSGVRP